jgi:hypothetical protein
VAGGSTGCTTGGSTESPLGAPQRVDERVERAHDDEERLCDHAGPGNLVAKRKEVFASFYKKKRLPSYA